MKIQRILLACTLMLATCGFFGANVGAQGIEVPGLVLGLRHTINQGWSASDHPNTRAPVIQFKGEDQRSSSISDKGFAWYMIRDLPSSDPGAWRLPSGLVVGLMHSQSFHALLGFARITAFGRPAYGKNSSLHFPGFQRQHGGDLGAPYGHGYYWYKSIGNQYNTWEVINKLPRYTVVGLKHSINQKNKRLYWPSIDPSIAKYGYDPVNKHCPPPLGFVRMEGGDLGAPTGHGYFWYEKITDPH